MTSPARMQFSAPGKALKSPLRMATMSLVPPPSLSASDLASAVLRPAAALTPQQLRLMQVSEFTAWLRTQTSPKTKRPYQENTITGYCEAARALDRWLESQGVDGDFTPCDAPMLNRPDGRRTAG